MVIILKKTLILSLFIVVLSLVILLSISSCSDTEKYYFTGKNNGENVDLNVGDIINLRLDSNITTGYSWELSETTDTEIISLESSLYENSQENEDIVGAGGAELFSFRAISAGQTDLILEYIRPWEEGMEPADSFTLKITVR